MPTGVPYGIDWGRSRRFLTFFFFSVVIVCLIAAFYRSLLVSVAISLFLTYLLSPFVSWVSKKLRLQRSYIVLAIISLLITILGFTSTFLIPVIYRQIVKILKLLPQAIDFMLAKIDPLKEVVVGTGIVDLKSLDLIVSEFGVVGQLSDQTTNLIEKLWLTTPSLLGGVLNLALVPLLLFFLLNDLPHLTSTLRKLVPPDLRDLTYFCRVKIDRTLKSVLKGQVIVAGILSVLYMLGFSIIRLEAGLAIGALAGICRVVPYLDVVVGIALSVVVIVTQNLGVGAVVGVGFVILIIQSIDGMFITPHVVGERAGLHPGVVLGSVIAFGDWFGFLGVLIAVPVVAVVFALIQIMIPYYQASPAFQTKVQKS